MTIPVKQQWKLVSDFTKFSGEGRTNRSKSMLRNLRKSWLNLRTWIDHWTSSWWR